MGVNLVRLGTLRYEAHGINAAACQVVAIEKARQFFGDDPKLMIKLVDIEPDVVAMTGEVAVWVARCEARPMFEGEGTDAS